MDYSYVLFCVIILFKLIFPYKKMGALFCLALKTNYALLGKSLALLLFPTSSLLTRSGYQSFLLFLLTPLFYPFVKKRIHTTGQNRTHSDLLPPIPKWAHLQHVPTQILKPNKSTWASKFGIIDPGGCVRLLTWHKNRLLGTKFHPVTLFSLKTLGDQSDKNEVPHRSLITSRIDIHNFKQITSKLVFIKPKMLK